MVTPESTLEHAFVSVKNLDRSLAFYRTLLPGWEIRWEGSSHGGRWIHFGPPGPGQPGYLSLYEDPHAGPADAPYASLRVQHLGFTHPDVNALVERLAKAKIESTEREDDGKYRRAYFEDPDGYELEFVQKLGD